MKLRDLNPGDRFIARFYAPDAEEGDKPILTITGSLMGVYNGNKNYCVVRLDGVDKDVYEPSDLYVEKIEGGE